jgi:hypothetical protein
MTVPPILQEPATWTRPMVTLSPMELMDMSWFPPTSTSRTTILEAKLLKFVDLPHKLYNFEFGKEAF